METHLLQDLAVVMAVAGAMTLLCHHLRQPVVIGYLIAGLFIGPYTPPFSLVSNFKSIHTMAELGLVFLLFSLGLEFNLPKIRKVGISAGLAAVLEVIGMMAIGYGLGRVFGWSRMDSIFLGAILSVSSTTIIVKVFMDFKMMHEKFVQVVFGILVLEDIVAIAILSILSGLGRQGGPDAAFVVGSFARIGLFVVMFLVLGLLFIPRFIHWVAGFKVKEVLGIVTLGICLGGAYIASFFQLSVALGAFLSGAILAASKEIEDIEEWIHPVRDMFSAIFFVSAGMLIQPQLLWQYKGAIIAVTLVTLVGKVLSGGIGSFLAGYDMKTSARVGMSLAQIGEFSFVIASLGVSLKVTSEFLYPLAIMVSSLTTLATPYLIRNSDVLVEGTLRAIPSGLCEKLDHYHAWLEKKGQTPSPATAIFSKYLVRFGVYMATLVTLVLLVNELSIVLMQHTWTDPPGFSWPVVALWLVSSILCLPLFLVISKYVNHVILLLVTRNKTLLHLINVHTFYNTLNSIVVSALEFSFVLLASRFIPVTMILSVMVTVLLSVSFFFRKRFKKGEEWLEGLLDQITGLATSEPTRQAVLMAAGGALALADITDQIVLPAGCPVLNQTIRDTKLREQSGATIVAIYREGRHIANPAPDTQLLADDVLVLLGNEEELKKARSLFGQ